MSILSVRLFGGFELATLDGEPLALTARKARAVLAVLVLEEGRWLSREWVAGLLWGDSAETKARNSLNQALYEIRKLETAVSATIVEKEAERVRLVSGSVDSDVRAFEVTLSDKTVEVARYRPDDLLRGIDVRDPGFLDWLSYKRDLYRNRLAAVLWDLASWQDKNEAFEVPLQAARELTVLNPLDEIARRRLIELLLQQGNRAEALRQYMICRELLMVELGVEPDTALQELYQTMLEHDAAASTVSIGEPDERQALIDTPGGEVRPVVAVMPFTNLDDDPKFAFMVDGFTQDIIIALSAFRSLRVLAHTATFRFRDIDLDHNGIRSALGAAYAVGGRVRRSERKLLISVELFDCRSGEQIWSGQYTNTIWWHLRNRRDNFAEHRSSHRTVAGSC